MYFTRDHGWGSLKLLSVVFELLLLTSNVEAHFTCTQSIHSGQVSLTLSCIYTHHIWMWSDCSKRKFHKHLHTLPAQRKLMDPGPYHWMEGALGGFGQGLNCTAVSKYLLCSIFLITVVGALMVGALMYPTQQCQDAETWFHWSAVVSCSTEADTKVIASTWLMTFMRFVSS